MSLANVDFDKMRLESEFWQDSCGHWCHCTQEFCGKHLADEDKWRLGLM